MGDLLTLSGVCKSFGALKANDEVDLSVTNREIHALIGPNGAGKSTLMQIIGGQLFADQGSIRFADREISTLLPTERAQQGLARTFQISAVASEHSVRQNIVLAIVGRERRAFQFWRAILKDTAVADEAAEIAAEVGLKELLAVPAGDLAHGDRRRLEVALAIALRPKMFLMDEPMAGMGPDGAVAMTGLLEKLADQRPILLVEHDMDAVFTLANRISVMVNGSVIARGSAADIKADPAVRAAYLGED